MKPFKLMSFSLLALAFLSNCSKEDDLQGNTMDITLFEPNSPATLNFNDFVVITYKYNIVHPEGVRMWIQPYTNGSKTEGYLYSSSKVFTGHGIRQVGVSVEDGDGPVVVDQLRVVMMDWDQEETLLEKFINVNYTFEE